MSKEIIAGTLHKYNFVQCAGGSSPHPELGKVIDMSKSVENELGIKDAYLKLYPCNGYGDAQMILTVMAIEQPDAIMLFTDPRYFVHVFEIAHTIRQKIPITFYNIWDSNNYPMYNRNFYHSTDLLMSISKQTYNINKWVIRPEHCITIDGEFDKLGNLNKFK